MQELHVKIVNNFFVRLDQIIIKEAIRCKVGDENFQKVECHIDNAINQQMDQIDNILKSE